MGKRIAKLLMTHELLAKLINDAGNTVDLDGNVMKNIDVEGVCQSSEQTMDGFFYVYIAHNHLPEKFEGEETLIIDGNRRTS